MTGTDLMGQYALLAVANPGKAIGQIVFVAIGWIVLVGWFSRIYYDSREVTSWAAAYGVDMTKRNRPMVTWFVRLNIVLRVIGGSAGVIIGSLFDDATGMRTSGGVGFWIWVIAGWLLGTYKAERSLERPGADKALASLSPREVADYAPRSLHLAPVIAAGLTVLLAIGGSVWPAPHDPQAPVPSDAMLAALGLLAVAMAAAVLLGQRRVVDRRQPALHPDLLAADDAVRASTIHHLGGGGTAAVLLVAAQLTWLVLEPRQVPLGLRGWAPVVLVLSAVIAWRFAAYRAWRVRRIVPGRATAVNTPIPAP